MKRYSLIIIATLAAIIVFSSACAPSAEVALASTPEPTLSAPAAPTVAPTPTASPVPTPTPIFSETRIAELNQQMQDFLNKEGEFTPEEMSSRMMEFCEGNGINFKSQLDMNAAGLGISSSQSHIQGYFFDYYEKDSRAFLLLGFDGEDGNRFITLAEMPFYLLESVESASFAFLKTTVNNIDGTDYDENGSFVQFGDRYESISCSDKNELFQQLNLLKGNIIAFIIDDRGNDSSILKEMDLDKAAYNLMVEYINESNSKVGLSFGLMELVTSNGIDYKRFIENGTQADKSSILRIENAKEIMNVDITKVPLTYQICFFEGILN